MPIAAVDGCRVVHVVDGIGARRRADDDANGAVWLDLVTSDRNTCLRHLFGNASERRLALARLPHRLAVASVSPCRHGAIEVQQRRGLRQYSVEVLDRRGYGIGDYHRAFSLGLANDPTPLIVAPSDPARRIPV